MRHIVQQRRRFILVYDLSEKAEQEYRSLQVLLEDLALSGSLRGVHTRHAHGDWKRNAGATAALSFNGARIFRAAPPQIVINIQPFALFTQGKALFFLPDRLLIRERGQYAALAYDALRLEGVEGSFVWEQSLPRDAEVIRMTWRFVRKDGGPDRRFSNNRQIPVVRVAYLSFESLTGLNIRIESTRVPAVQRMAAQFEYVTAGNRQRLAATSVPPSLPPQVVAALATFGLDVMPTALTLRDMYRDLAKRNHPDKFAQAPADIRAFAEERMKEINAAYRLLTSMVPHSPTEPVPPHPAISAPESSPVSLSTYQPTLSPWSVAGTALAYLAVFVIFRAGTGIVEHQPGPAKFTQTATVAADPARNFKDSMPHACQVRSSPSPTGKVVGSVNRGELIRIVDQKQGWKNIVTPDIC